MKLFALVEDMSSLKKVNLLQYFKQEMFILTCFGLYPLNRTLSCKFKAFLTMLLLVSQIVSMIVKLGSLLNNLMAMVGATLFCITQVAMLCKVLNFYFSYGKLQKITLLLGLNCFNKLNCKNIRLLEGAMTRCNYFGNIYRFCCFAVISSEALAPFIDEKNLIKRRLPLPSWVPWNEIDTYFKYLSWYFLQVCSLYFGALVNSSVDMFNCKLISLATINLEFLIRKLEENDFSLSGSEQQFNLIVNYHKKILGFTQGIEDIFTYPIIVQYIASIFVICSAGFELFFLNTSKLRAGDLTLYFFTMVLQVGLYCWYGQHLMSKSTQLTTACYLSNWYEANSKLRKNIFIFMERSKIPLVLTAGKFFNLSLHTFTSILRSSYSYFAVLQRLYDNPQ